MSETRESPEIEYRGAGLNIIRNQAGEIIFAEEVEDRQTRGWLTTPRLFFFLMAGVVSGCVSRFIDWY